MFARLSLCLRVCMCVGVWESEFNLQVCKIICILVTITGFHVFLYSVCKFTYCRGLRCVCVYVPVCGCVQMGHVVLFKWPPLRWWPVINEWARESGRRDSWLGREGIEREREGGKRWRCVCVEESVCSRAREDKARHRDGKSLRIDKEWAWEDEGKTMEGAIVRDCGLVGVEQYLDQRWKLFLCCHLFFLSSLPPHTPFFVSLKSPCSPAEIWLLLGLV